VILPATLTRTLKELLRATLFGHSKVMTGHLAGVGVGNGEGFGAGEGVGIGVLVDLISGVGVGVKIRGNVLRSCIEGLILSTRLRRIRFRRAVSAEFGNGVCWGTDDSIGGRRFT